MMRVLLTAGHVDHGKSTLVRTLTGMEPDRLEEERRRGLTIDLGFVWGPVRDRSGREAEVAFVDVPGHHRFVTNMLAGAGPISSAVLVVAADDGWSPQSAEHLTILDLLGISGVAVAITKCDTVSAARVKDVTVDVGTRIAATSLRDAPLVAVDSLTGRGLDDLRDALVRRLADLGPPAWIPGARLWIDRAFPIQGAGTVVTGTLQGGPLRTGETVHLASSGQALRIRGLESLGEPITTAGPGSRVAVNLTGISHHALHRGDALLLGDWAVTDRVTLRVRNVSERAITARGSWTVHVGSAESTAVLRPLDGPIEAGGLGAAHARFQRPLPLRVDDRMIVRSSGIQATVAGGTVVDPLHPRPPRGRMARERAVQSVMSEPRGISPGRQARRLLDLHEGILTAGQVAQALGSLPPSGVRDAVRVGPLFVGADRFRSWGAAVLDHVTDDGRSGGSPLSGVLEAVAMAGCPEPARRALVDLLIETGRLERYGDRIVPSGEGTRYRTSAQEQRVKLVAALERDALSPPDLQQVVAALEIPAMEVQRMFASGRLVRVGRLVLLDTSIDGAVGRLHDTFGPEPFTAAQARDAWETTRRFAMPLLEHLRASGVTTFDGQHHRLRPNRSRSPVSDQPHRGNNADDP